MYVPTFSLPRQNAHIRFASGSLTKYLPTLQLIRYTYLPYSVNPLARLRPTTTTSLPTTSYLLRPQLQPTSKRLEHLLWGHRDPTIITQGWKVKGGGADRLANLHLSAASERDDHSRHVRKREKKKWLQRPALLATSTLFKKKKIIRSKEERERGSTY